MLREVEVEVDVKSHISYQYQHILNQLGLETAVLYSPYSIHDATMHKRLRQDEDELPCIKMKSSSKHLLAFV